MRIAKAPIRQNILLVMSFEKAHVQRLRWVWAFAIWAAAWQNQQNGMCAQWRLRSARAFAQSDQSSLCTQRVAKDLSFLHADSKDFDQTGWMPRLIWVLLGTQIILLVLSWGGSIIFAIYWTRGNLRQRALCLILSYHMTSRLWVK